MPRRIPVLATAVVAAAVAVMIGLGLWQLDRRGEKEALLARYERGAAMSSEIPWPVTPVEEERAAYRHSRVTCARVDAIEPRAGRSQAGVMGWAHEARCALPGGGDARVALGWSAEPAPVAWAGGEVRGTIGPAGHGIKLVAAPPQAGLEQLASPDPRDIPNNHLAYAVQWFLFALTAVIVYVLALRRRGT